KVEPHRVHAGRLKERVGPVEENLISEARTIPAAFSAVVGSPCFVKTPVCNSIRQVERKLAVPPSRALCLHKFPKTFAQNALLKRHSEAVNWRTAAEVNTSRATYSLGSGTKSRQPKFRPNLLREYLCSCEQCIFFLTALAQRPVGQGKASFPELSLPDIPGVVVNSVLYDSGIRVTVDIAGSILNRFFDCFVPGHKVKVCHPVPMRMCIVDPVPAAPYLARIA